MANWRGQVTVSNMKTSNTVDSLREKAHRDGVGGLSRFSVETSR